MRPLPCQVFSMPGNIDSARLMDCLFSEGHMPTAEDEHYRNKTQQDLRQLWRPVGFPNNQAYQCAQPQAGQKSKNMS